MFIYLPSLVAVILFYLIVYKKILKLGVPPSSGTAFFSKKRGI